MMKEGSRMGKEVGKSMATVDERVKKIIAEQLGVEEDEVTPEGAFRRRSWAPIRSIRLSW